MLKHLFTSKARIKLLTNFLLNPDGEFFIRELTRKLDEQINSVRRELDNLKKLGLLRSRMRNRKKYYIVNKKFILYNELRSIVIKSMNSQENTIKKIKKLGEVELLILSGIFIDKDAHADLLIVGNIDKNQLENYLTNELETKKPIRFSIMSKEDFLYRLKCKDRFVQDMLTDTDNIVGINKLEKHTG